MKNKFFRVLPARVFNGETLLINSRGAMLWLDCKVFDCKFGLWMMLVHLRTWYDYLNETGTFGPQFRCNTEYAFWYSLSRQIEPLIPSDFY